MKIILLIMCLFFQALAQTRQSLGQLEGHYNPSNKKVSFVFYPQGNDPKVGIYSISRFEKNEGINLKSGKKLKCTDQPVKIFERKIKNASVMPHFYHPVVTYLAQITFQRDSSNRIKLFKQVRIPAEQ